MRKYTSTTNYRKPTSRNRGSLQPIRTGTLLPPNIYKLNSFNERLLNLKVIDCEGLKPLALSTSLRLSLVPLNRYLTLKTKPYFSFRHDPNSNMAYWNSFGINLDY